MIRSGSAGIGAQTGARGARPQPMLWTRQERPQPLAGAAGRSAAPGAQSSGQDSIALPQWLRPARLLPYLAAALGGHLGLRLRLRVEPDGADAMADAVPLGSVGSQDGTLFLAMDGDSAMELLSAVFGSDRAMCPPETVMLPDLAPDSGSWTAFGALVRAAAGRAMMEAGAEGVAPERPKPADAKADRAHRSLLSVSGPGVQAMLELRFAPTGQAPATAAAPDDARMAASAASAKGAGGPWERRLQALSRAVPLPVCLELHAVDLPLARVMRLGVGDVIALPAIRSMTMKVAGEPWAEVPVAALAGPDAGAAGRAADRPDGADPAGNSKGGRP